MAKRFTATNKWDKEWFMKLSCKHKCLWQYINDKCDQAGMWEVNYTLATLHIGESITDKDLAVFGDRVEKFSVGKIWIVDHVDFQSGTLSEKSPAHKPIFKLLKKYSLLDRVLSRVSNTLQEKEIEKEKEEDKEKEKGGNGIFYINAQEAFEDISNNYKETEPQRNILTNRGWKSASKTDTDALLYHFLESQTQLEIQKIYDVKSHFRRWLNKQPIEELQTLAKKIHERFQTEVR